MPLYDFECVNCGTKEERFFKIDDCPESIRCLECGELAVKVLVPGHGGTFCDSETDVPWLASAVQNLQADHETPIQTRGEYNRYLKEKNIIAAG